jgi:hypothetical protein
MKKIADDSTGLLYGLLFESVLHAVRKGRPKRDDVHESLAFLTALRANIF